MPTTTTTATDLPTAGAKKQVRQETSADGCPAPKRPRKAALPQQAGQKKTQKQKPAAAATATAETVEQKVARLQRELAEAQQQLLLSQQNQNNGGTAANPPPPPPPQPPQPAQADNEGQQPAAEEITEQAPADEEEEEKGTATTTEEEEQENKKQEGEKEKEEEEEEGENDGGRAAEFDISDASELDEEEEERKAEAARAARAARRAETAASGGGEGEEGPFSPTTKFQWEAEAHRTVEQMAPEARAFCEWNRVQITGKAVESFVPVASPEELNLPPKMAAYMKGFPNPTPIQSAAWHFAKQQQQRDLIGIAETGSGKTLAFALPALQATEAVPLRPKQFPILVMAPTRELVTQIWTVFNHLGARAVAVYGGVSAEGQIAALAKGVAATVATPGRLLDLLQRRKLALSGVAYAVLDEADCMLDIGFEEPIRRILAQCAADRQTVLFTATWPRKIQALADEFVQKDPVKIVIGSAKLTANKRVNQRVETVHGLFLDERLVEVLREDPERAKRVLVFVGLAAQVPRVAAMLNTKGFKAGAIYGKLKQNARDQLLQQFRRGKLPVLVATDVASRGLDIDDVSLVVNYNLPPSIDTYIHRIGRTARAGKDGTAVSFFDAKADGGIGAKLARVLAEAGMPVPPFLNRFGVVPPAATDNAAGKRTAFDSDSD